MPLQVSERAPAATREHCRRGGLHTAGIYWSQLWSSEHLRGWAVVKALFWDADDGFLAVTSHGREEREGKRFSLSITALKFKMNHLPEAAPLPHSLLISSPKGLSFQHVNLRGDTNMLPHYQWRSHISSTTLCLNPNPALEYGCICLFDTVGLLPSVRLKGRLTQMGKSCRRTEDPRGNRPPQNGLLPGPGGSGSLSFPSGQAV